MTGKYCFPGSFYCTSIYNTIRDSNSIRVRLKLLVLAIYIYII